MMQKSINIGAQGENLARNWLQNQGFEILEHNYRLRNLEVDIIARRGQFVHFIEVKTRSSTNFGEPEDFVDSSKLERMKIVAVQYLEERPQLQKLWPQYDIIAITWKNNSPQIHYINDIF